MAKKLINKNVALMLLSAAGFMVYNILANAGSLEPSSPPAPTMKTLDEIEPRTPIDTLPFTIEYPGSYYVTQNLYGSPFDDGITIKADNVTLDLGGFTLTGVLEIQPNVGIDVNDVHENITIYNGVMRNWATAVNASSATNSRIRNLRVEVNAGDGIIIGAGSSVVRCSAQNNTGNGIEAGDGCVVIECTARTNTDTGIKTGFGCTVATCTASSNTGGSSDGIYVNGGSTVTDCTVYDNGNDGIRVFNGCTITGCTARDNGDNGINAGDNVGSTVTGCTAYLNGGDGISITKGTVRGCSTRQNNGDGILADDSLVHGNASTGNVGSPINATFSTLIDNHT